MFLVEETRTPETPRIGKPLATASEAGRKHLPPGKHPRRQQIQAAEKASSASRNEAENNVPDCLPDIRTPFRQVNLGETGKSTCQQPQAPVEPLLPVIRTGKTSRSCSPPPASSGALFPSITRMKHKRLSQRIMERNTAEKRTAEALPVIEEMQKHLDPWFTA